MPPSWHALHLACARTRDPLNYQNLITSWRDFRLDVAMEFTATQLPGVLILELDRKCDQRGFFARTWCKSEFAEHEIDVPFVQCSTSFNILKGTLRGMHYQADPFAMERLVRVTAGAIFDVVIDLRPESPAFTRWVGVELNSDNRRSLWIPKGCAHGFQTLVNDTEVFYQLTQFHHPESERGARWDDPCFDIEWPACEQRTIAARDLAFADFIV